MSGITHYVIIRYYINTRLNNKGKQEMSVYVILFIVYFSSLISSRGVQQSTVNLKMKHNYISSGSDIKIYIFKIIAH